MPNSALMMPHASVLPPLALASLAVPTPFASKYTVWLAHTAIGAVLSTVVTLAVQVELLPLLSETVSVTGIVVPSGQVKAVWLAENVKPGQLSELPLLTLLGTKVALPLLSKVRVTFWQIAVGGVTSVTVTIKEQEEVAPLAAETTKVTVVFPMGKAAPEAKPAVRAVVAPGQLSVPTGVV